MAKRKSATKHSSSSEQNNNDDIVLKKKLSISAKNQNQIDLIKSINQNIITFAAGPPGTGKAQPLYSTVKTPIGDKQIKDIKKGDEVLTPRGKSNVVEVYPQGEKEVYEVKFSDSAIVSCCKDHLWMVSINKEKVLLSTKDLQEKLKDNECFVPLPDVACEYEKRDVQFSPNVFGYLLAFTDFSEQNKDVNYFLNFCDDYLFNIGDVRKEIVSTMMDESGRVSKDGNAYLMVKNYKVAIFFKNLLESLCGICKIDPGFNCYYCQIIKYDYNLFKYFKAQYRREEKQIEGRRIISIEKKAVEECKCILIEDDYHLYLTDFHIVTHNTLIGVVYALKGLLQGEYDKIIFSRPCIEAEGENLGFLPGDFNEKIYPYMMPIFNFLDEFLEKKTINYLIKEDKIQTLPLAYQRGFSFYNSFVLLDECLSGDSYVTSVKINDKYHKSLTMLQIKDLLNEDNKIEVLSLSKDNKLEYKKVTCFFENGKKRLYKIFIDDQEILATENHPFATFENGSINWKQLKDIDVNNHWGIIKDKGYILSKKNYDILLGLLLGKAKLEKINNNKNLFKFSKKGRDVDYDYLYKCIKILRKDNNFKIEKLDNKIVKSKVTCEIQGVDSFLDIKNVLSNFSIRSLALLYMDLGEIEDDKIKINISHLKTEIKNDLLSIVKRDFDKESYIYKNYIYLNKQILEILAEYIFMEKKDLLFFGLKGLFDKNKYIQYYDYENISLRKFKKREDSYVSDVYNLEVEDNNNFFVDNILVHNCQNTTPAQMRMFLTRTGENCKVVVTGDPQQSDIRGRNGLVHAVKLFEDEEEIGIIEFSDDDIVRSEIVKLIESKYCKDK